MEIYKNKKTMTCLKKIQNTDVFTISLWKIKHTNYNSNDMTIKLNNMNITNNNN